MVGAGLSHSKRFLLGAVIAALSAVVSAHPGGMQHQGGGHGRYAPAGSAMPVRSGTPDRVIPQHEAENRFPDGYRAVEGRPPMQYAGAITPVSAERVPRPPTDGTIVRAGSIRADVARYNEERGGKGFAHPPGEGGRPPAEGPYRN